MILAETNSSRLKAFTLVEVMVVMVITGAIISLSAYLYFQFRNHVTNLDRENNLDFQVALLNSYLQRDVDRCDIMRYNSYFKRLEFLKGKNTMSAYDFENDKVIVKTNKFKEVFACTPSMIAYEKHKKHRYLTEEFSFKVRLDTRLSYTIRLRKTYTPLVLFNLEKE